MQSAHESAYCGGLTGRSLTGENRSRRLSAGAANSGRMLPTSVSLAGSTCIVVRDAICTRSPVRVCWQVSTPPLLPARRNHLSGGHGAG